MKFSITYFLLALGLVYTSSSWANTENKPSNTSLVFTNIAGNIWIEDDANSTYNGESGPSGVIVYLYDNEEDTIIAQSISVEGKYEFNGIAAGKYYLRIDNSAFELGGPLSGHQSCVGANDADNMVDDDDNGSDTTPDDVLSSPFNLVNSDPMNVVSIEYIDFCFNFVCEDQNQITTTSCSLLSNSDFICDVSALNGFCTVMPSDSSTGIQPMPLCDNFSASENISWLAFIASDGNYTMTFSAFDCTIGNLGQQGIQVGVYTDCTFSEAVFCSEQCSTNPINIGSSLLNPGQVYYLYINGCNGNVCNYQINISGSPVIPSLEPEDVCVFSGGVFQCQDISYCPNSDILFQGQGISLNGDYTWKISTLSGDPYLEDPSPITTNNALTINIPTEGVYEVCLVAIDNGCIDQTWTGQVCRNVTISSLIVMPLDEDFGEYTVCEDDLNEFTINVFASEDPNNDGDPGWNAPIPDYMLGLNEGTVYIEGCSYEQQFTLSAFPPSPVEDVLISVCEEDLPVQIDILTITTFTFSGQQTISLDNLLLQNTQDQNGCDSIINLTIEKLGILLGFLEDPICTMDGITIQFNYISDLSTDIDFLTFEWFDPLGNPLPFGQDPTSVLAPFDGGNGEYTLSVTINKNGVSCNYMYSTFVNIESFLPPVPTIMGPNIVCEEEGSVVYIAQGAGDETTFIWSFPNDVTSAIVSGSQNEILTIDWAGSSGGQVSAIGQNICGQSNLSSYNVDVVPTSTPNFSIDTSICINNPASINFIGSNLNIENYSWDFDGGMVISGIGSGPYLVSWNTTGEKFISLFTTDTNGCISNTTTKSIPVQMPLAPTEVMCISSVGEVVFTWEIPLMVSGFEVNVLSGQSGGVFSPNSFTVSGLEEGEEVTIELLTKPDDPICGEVVSTIASCIASDCVSPEIELLAEQNICVDGENITIEATITSGETGIGVFTGPGIIDAANGVFDPSLANIGINTILYSFTSDVAGCEGSKTISIEVFDLPVSSFTQDVDTICITDFVNLDYTGTANPETFNWDFDGGEGSGLLTDQKVIYSSEGLKTISLQVVKNGCVSNVFTSTVLVEPELELVEVQCDTAGTDFVVFSWNNITGAPLFEIKIDNDPPFFSPNTSITIDGLAEDQEVSISITSISITSCPGSTSSSLCKTTKTPVSSEDLLFSNLKLYPNPVQDLIFIDGVKDNRLSFQVFSIIGQTIKVGLLENKSIDLSTIPRGIYILRIKDEKTKTHKDFKVAKE